MIDQFLEGSPNLGVDTFFLLLVLVALEAVLSADNAIALASISKGLEDPKQQQQALNYGLIIAFVLRVALILTATWVIKFWQFELLGALYLLWLVFQHFSSNPDAEGEDQGPRFGSLVQAIPVIAMTDLAFSLDSVTTAIAISDEIWLVVTGATIGIIALRFMAELFIRWLDEFVHLEDAGYITVGFVGMRLLVRVIDDSLVPPQWLLISSIALMFIWGFSKRTSEALEIAESSEIALNPNDSEVVLPESQEAQKSEI
ncbi:MULTISPECIES: TerC family protein [unclassified Microcoleus]|uniref:TerC family protein n=1 Tax=unclassified Microcoleus TaxID=2642155 RepID=UPI002FCF2A51